ncbi:MAG TPA: hypothetical protein ENJ27_00605 [Candidatus Moranbacteria bacterium]|nr:hypothetical protein [Candidatus Moranbacteria bacterium]
MLQTFQALFRALRTASTAEARSMSRVLYFYIFSGYTLAAIQAAVPNLHNMIVILGLAIIGANAFQLFRVGRLIRLTAVGEALELARVIPIEEGITANKLIGLYWDIAIQLFIFMTGFCLLVPYLSLQREWWLAIAWPTLFILIGILFGMLGRVFLRIVSTTMLLLVMATVLSATFPQVNAQLHLGGILSRILPNELADQVNTISELREQQRKSQIKSDLEEVRIWVAEYPNTPYPEDFRKFLDAVSNGNPKTLSEIRAEILWEKENSPPPPKSKKKIGKWENVGIFPIPIDKKMFNLVSGRNGERAGTGEMWIPYILLPDWEYKITFSGGYQKLFWHLPWISIPYRGDDGVAGQGVRKPFKLPYGALVLRVGKVSIFPAENTNSVFCQAKNTTKIFAELNINREPAEYYTPKLGFKLRNKNLSIKIERRRILKE